MTLQSVLQTLGISKPAEIADLPIFWYEQNTDVVYTLPNGEITFGKVLETNIVNQTAHVTYYWLNGWCDEWLSVNELESEAYLWSVMS